MTCSLWQFSEALDGEEPDLELLRRLLKRCARKSFGSKAFRAFIRRGVRFAMELAWSYYQDSAAPADAYWRAAFFFWDLVNWPSLSCRALAELVAYVAKAAARYSWPLKWPFLVMAAVAAEKNGCKLPDAVAKALGAEYEALTAFLERGEAAVEVAGRKYAVIRKRRSIVVANLDS